MWPALARVSDNWTKVLVCGYRKASLTDHRRLEPGASVSQPSQYCVPNPPPPITQESKLIWATFARPPLCSRRLMFWNQETRRGVPRFPTGCLGSGLLAERGFSAEGNHAAGMIRCAKESVGPLLVLDHLEFIEVCGTGLSDTFRLAQRTKERSVCPVRPGESRETKIPAIPANGILASADDKL
jgi:hypothetical protein